MIGDSAGVPDFLLGDSYISHTELRQRVWTSVGPCVSTAPLRALRRCVFGILKPDALAGRKYDAIWSALTNAGVEPIYVRACLDAGPAHYEELYKFNLTLCNEQNMLSAWWLNARLYDRGPSLAMLLRVRPEACGPLEAYAYVARLKGPSDPYQALPGTIRHDVRATNTALNLVHMADDPLSSAREFLIFARSDELANALETAVRLDADDQGQPRVSDRMRAAFEEALVTINSPAHDLDLVANLLVVKMRLRSHLRSDLRDLTAEVYGRYQLLRDERPSLLTSWQRFVRLSREELRLLRPALLERDPAWQALVALAGVSSYGSGVASALSTALYTLRLPYTDWERLVVETSLYYFDTMRRLAEDA